MKNLKFAFLIALILSVKSTRSSRPKNPPDFRPFKSDSACRERLAFRRAKRYRSRARLAEGAISLEGWSMAVGLWNWPGHRRDLLADGIGHHDW